MSPPFRVQLSPEARLHIATINIWWAQNRSAAPTLLASEFEIAIKQLSEHPDSGRAHQDRGRQGVRKLLLPRTRYHVYYEIEEEDRLVTILAVWHVSRGHGPRL